jgi:hypothetical protein
MNLLARERLRARRDDASAGECGSETEEGAAVHEIVLVIPGHARQRVDPESGDAARDSQVRNGAP